MAKFAEKCSPCMLSRHVVLNTESDIVENRPVSSEAINSGGTDLLTESIPTELQVSNSHSAESVMMENSSVMSQEPAMPVTEYVSSSKVFFNVDPRCEKLAHKLARLFEKEETRRLTISFKEATERLQTAVEKSLYDVENTANLKVAEFKIGKASVTSKENVPFDPMELKTWGAVGGIIEKLQEYKRDKYDGLIAVGCVTNELIPKVIKETNTAIPVDHQMYAIGMAQALIHHYMGHVPDGRLRNKSFGIGNCSEENRGDKGGFIYVAYKLELLGGRRITDEEQERSPSSDLFDYSFPKLQEDQRFGTSTSSPVQGTSHEKNLEETNVSEEEEEKGPEEEKIMRVKKMMTKNERKLILVSYKKLATSDDWDELAEKVYKERNQYLSTAMVKHYEYLHAQSKLKDRIKNYIHRVKRGTVGNETDQEIVALMKDLSLVQ